MLFSKRCGGKCCEGNALIGRPEKHVESHIRLGDCFGIKAPELRGGIACVEKTGVKKIRANPSRLERKLSESENTELQCQFDELSFISSHLLRLPMLVFRCWSSDGLCMMSAVGSISDRIMTQE